MQAITIPATTPERYISYKHALNLRLPGEDTGDWHFDSAFFGGEGDRRAPLAGVGEAVNTVLALGSHGVRDMGDVLARQGVREPNGPVYVADHYRAIADLAMLELSIGRIPSIATPRAINSWLDTEDQIATLRNEYLAPLRDLLDGPGKEAFDGWMHKVVYH